VMHMLSCARLRCHTSADSHNPAASLASSVQHAFLYISPTYNGSAYAACCTPSRYFDDVYEPKGVACWRCGKRGHLAKDCSLSAAKPCYYCAQYGHEPFSCPHSKCSAENM
jgi:hypothetical protein